MSRVFIVDDEVQMAELLSAAIDSLGLQTEYYTNPRYFIKVEVNPEDLILLDLNMPDIDGIEVIRSLAENHCGAKLILISGHDKGVLNSAEKLAQAHSLTVAASLTKPIQIEGLKNIVSRVMSDSSPSDKSQGGVDLMPTVDELRQALLNNEFVLHFQPQMGVKTGKLKGVEALVRWQHPSRGLLYPNLFISLAEQHGLIGDLTSNVIGMAIEQSRAWLEQGLVTQVSVNISADNITTLSLPEQLSQLLTENRLDPTLLILEVTESALMGELVTSLDILTRLRMKGFGLSIDDFGTGYSSLSQLHRIPFTELKIDQSFIMTMEQDDEAQAIVKTCILLGHELNMEVVAEGVESARILAMLENFGCDIVQGYYISRPLAADDLFQWAQSQAKP